MPGKIKLKQPKQKKQKPKATAEHASATSKKPTGTDSDKIKTEQDHLAALKASKEWAQATDVQSAAGAWDATTAQLGTNGASIDKMRSDLAAAVIVQQGLRLKWHAGRKHTLSAVNVFAAGDAQIITDMGFDVLTHAPAGTEITVPTGIVTGTGVMSGEVQVAWDEGDNRHGFMVQHATNPADATTYSQLVPCTSASFTLDGQPPGTVVHFRIASIDPSLKGHMTAWSPWIAGTVAQ